MEVLQLDVSGRPQAWLSAKEAAVIYASDGVAWTTTDLETQYLTTAPTTGDDVIFGFDNSSDTIRGGGGNDTMNGLSWDDTYLHEAWNDSESVRAVLLIDIVRPDMPRSLTALNNMIIFLLRLWIALKYPKTWKLPSNFFRRF